MNRTSRMTTIDTGHTDEALRDGYTTLQTTLYDLMQAMQDEAEPDEEALIVDAVMQLIQSGRIRFLGQRLHLASMTCYEAFPVSA